MAEAGAAPGALQRGDLARNGLVAAALAFAGLPLYVHAPRFYAEEMAVSLPALGAVLLAARAVDSVQDPLIGWLADRLRAVREVWAAAAVLMLAAGFVTLFSPPGLGAALPRLGLGLLLAFTGFSALQIALYDHGLAMARAAGVILPALSLAGYDPGADPGPDAASGRAALSVAYALVPCALKVLAIAALMLIPDDKETRHATA